MKTAIATLLQSVVASSSDKWVWWKRMDPGGSHFDAAVLKWIPFEKVPGSGGD